MNNKHPTLLIIDDDVLALERLTNLLDDEFFCCTAATGIQGLDLFERIAHENPLIICDVDLPDIVGFDICKTIKSRYPSTYVMLLTGYCSKTVRMKGLHSYADNCIDKTLDDTEIKLLIRNAYNTKHPRATINTPISIHKINSSALPSDFEIKVKLYINTYYEKSPIERNKDALTLAKISSHFNLTQRTFQRKIKEVAGCSYTKYLNQNKIDRSKELLDNRFSITEISELLDYSSPSHFSREFKKSTSVTPNKYKKLIISCIDL